MIYKYIIILTLTLITSACGSNSDHKPNPTNQTKSITFNDLAADDSNLQALEKSLEVVGLKFKVDSSNKTNNMEYSTVIFDKELASNYATNHPDNYQNNMAQALNNYITSAEIFLQKYSGNLKQFEDNPELETLASKIIIDTKNKITLSKDALETLQFLGTN